MRRYGTDQAIEVSSAFTFGITGSVPVSTVIFSHSFPGLSRWGVAG